MKLTVDFIVDDNARALGGKFVLELIKLCNKHPYNEKIAMSSTVWNKE